MGTPINFKAQGFIPVIHKEDVNIQYQRIQLVLSDSLNFSETKIDKQAIKNIVFESVIRFFFSSLGKG